MQYLPKIIAIKNGKEKVSYLVPELEPILSKTYGSIIYQEQVMQIFQSLAGYSLGQADIVRRYMSKKKVEKLAHEREAFIHGDEARGIPGCVKNGISEENANTLFDEMTEFAKYVFNKSHAAAYAMVAYMTAYLKWFYPVEYLSAAMNYSTLDKIPGLMADCKERGIKVLSPDINLSENEFAPLKNEILVGLGGIKNVGAGAEAILSERKKNGKFVSLKDFLLRCSKTDKKVKESLIGAGAFDCFSSNRMAINLIIEDASAAAKKLNEAQSELEELKSENIEGFTKRQKTSHKQKIENREKTIQQAKEQLQMLVIPTNLPEDKKAKLNKEKELLGIYVSGSPLDDYPSPKELKCDEISDLTEDKDVSIMGEIVGLRKVARKSDGSPMAFFTLEDKAGSIDCCCFTKAYAEYGIYCVEGDIVKLTGDVREDEEENKLVFYIKNIEPVAKKMSPLLLQVNDMMEWTEKVQPALQPYFDPAGCQLMIHDRLFNEVRECTQRVKPEIRSLGFPVVELSKSRD